LSGLLKIKKSRRSRLCRNSYKKQKSEKRPHI